MDNVRIEQLLGNKKVIVGTKYNDLVLETLGKVYIKSGNNFKLLTELIGTLNKSDPKNALIVSNVTEMENMKYPGDGYFVFSSLNKALYISYDGRYIKLIETNEEENPDYVKKSGDTMTGPLEINTTSAPLIVASSELIKNLNSEQVGGYKAEDLAKIRKDEIIYGLWTFKNPCVSEDLWTFNKNVDVKGDIIIKGSLGSPSFASGFGGYGWRFDANTNTLTVDYLVVRKAMNVYELVVNQITATNGSLWVSNATTIEEVEQPLIVTVNQLNYFEQEESNSQVGWQGTDLQKERFKALFFENKYYLITDDVIGDTLSTNGDTKGREDQSPQDNSIVKETTGLSTSSDINSTEKVFVNYKYLIKIVDIDGLLNSSNFQGKSTFLNEDSLKGLSDYITFTYISKKVYDGTYIETFDKNCGFYAKVQDTKIKIKSYYKYYGLKKETIQSVIDSCIEYFNNTHNKSLSYTVPNLYIITSEDYTYFKPGDVVRCQKFQDGNVKYYDAIVLSQIAAKSVIIQKADSVFDQYTEVEYVDGNKVQYTTTYSDMAYSNGEKVYDVDTDSDGYLEGYETEEERLSSRLAEPAVEDDIVQMGNIYDSTRQSAIYITSTDDQSPYIDVISDVNRPDYSVLYEIPVFKRESYINTTVDNGYRGVRYNYYLLSPTTENSQIPNVVPIYINNTLTYYGTTTPMDNSLIEQVNGQDHYEYTSSTKVRVGKLDGITNYLFKDKQPYGYGLYGENVFLTGEFYLNNGSSVVDFSKDYIDLQVKNVTDGLLSTGINIQNKTITVTADLFKVQANNGTQIGAFINDGNNVYFNANLIKSKSITASMINANGITANNVDISGKITATSGEFKGNIIAQGGTIGGFKIETNRLESQSFYNDNYINLSPGNIKIYTKNSDYYGTTTNSVSIGGTFLGSSGIKVFNFINTTYTKGSMPYNPSIPCIGLHVSASGSTRFIDSQLTGNHAIYIPNGFISGLRLNVSIITSNNHSLSTDKYYTLSHMETYVYIAAGVNGVYLPSSPQEGQMYIIRKGNYNNVIYIKTTGNNIICNAEGINTRDFTHTSSVEGRQVAFLVYSGVRLVGTEKQGIWYFNYWG